MRIFRISHDDKYSYFFNKNEEDSHRFRSSWDCSPKAADWVPPPVFIYEPKLRKGDFFNYDDGYIIASPRATDILRDEFEAAGELLPLPYQGDEYCLLNVTACFDCLDHRKTVRRISPGGIPLHITKYVFDEHLISERTLIFKIPEEEKASIFVVEGLVEDEFEIRNVIKENKLNGLVFTEVWNSESSP